MQPEGPNQNLNSWIGMFDRIYYQSHNHERSVHQILLRALEIVLNLQKAAIKRCDYKECREIWLPKLFAWCCALTRIVGITDLDHLVWEKFPSACPFCLKTPCACKPNRKLEIDRHALGEIARANAGSHPASLNEWQKCFEAIYQQSTRGLFLSTKGASSEPDALRRETLLKLYEELLELAEAIRLNAFYPDNTRNEIADVFACVFGLANALPRTFEEQQSIDLGALVWNNYPGTCDTCKQRVCTCRPSALRERLSSEGIREFERKDSLTGLFNRAQLDIDRHRLFAQTEEVRVGELFFDVDNFKQFNSAAGGHNQGDEALKAIARILQRFENSQTIPYRMAGDEFVVLVHGTTDAQVREAARQIFEGLRDQSVIDISGGAASFKISVSGGLALRARSMKNAEDLHYRADQLAITAKNSGKARLESD